MCKMEDYLSLTPNQLNFFQIVCLLRIAGKFSLEIWLYYLYVANCLEVQFAGIFKMLSVLSKQAATYSEEGVTNRVLK